MMRESDIVDNILCDFEKKITQRIITMEKVLHERIDKIARENAFMQAADHDIITGFNERFDKLESRIKELEKKNLDPKQWVK